jgi:cephalosporin-C deacetylase-like acetyl esterase
VCDKSSSSNTANAYTDTHLKGRIVRGGERGRNRFYYALVFADVASPKLLK